MFGAAPFPDRASVALGEQARQVTLRSQVVRPDNMLDAMAASWTAERVLLGTAQTMPEGPPTNLDGLRMEIVR